jgi:hypothetical protein
MPSCSAAGDMDLFFPEQIRQFLSQGVKRIFPADSCRILSLIALQAIDSPLARLWNC